MLDDLFQDDKSRVIHWESDFGDIVFQETVRDRSLYRILFIQWHDNTSDKTHRLHFYHYNIGKTKDELWAFLNDKAQHPELAEIWVEASTRFGRIDNLSREMPKSESQVYVGETSPYRKTIAETYHVKDRTDFYLWAIQNNDWGGRVFSNYRFSGLVKNDPVLTKDVTVSLTSSKDQAPWNSYRCLHSASFYGLSKPVLDWQIGQNVFFSSVSLGDFYLLISERFFEAVFELPHLANFCFGQGKHSEILPPGLSNLKTLRYLALDGPCLSDPNEIGALANLRELALGQMTLSDTSWLSMLTKLEKLTLYDCTISEFPDQVRHLPNLNSINLQGSKFGDVPNWISELVGLEYLNLSKCGLETLPSEIAQFPQLKTLKLKKNPFVILPDSLGTFGKNIIDLELRHQAKYDPKAAKKIEKFPTGSHKFSADFGLKLLVINQLMFVDEVLLPKFNVREFAQKMSIDIEAVGYDPLPEVEEFFRNLDIPLELCLDIVELEPDGAWEIFGQVWPYWSGEEIDHFLIKCLDDLQFLPRLKSLNGFCLDKDMKKKVRAQKIKVPSI